MSRLKKLFVSLAVCCFLSVLTACQNQQDEIYSAYTEPTTPESQESVAGDADATGDADDASEDDPEESPNYIGPPKSELQDLEPIAGDTLSGELTVKTDIYWAEQRGLYFFVKEFMQLHPDVTINIEYDLNFMQNRMFSREEQRMRRENFYNQVRMELASGEADYLLYDVGEELDLVALSRSDILTDLRPYWENDPDIAKESFYENVLEAFAVDGKMTVIPASFTYGGIYFNKGALERTDADMDHIHTVTSGDILSWYGQARRQEDSFNLFYNAVEKSNLFSVERLQYIDLDGHEASFDSPGFIDYLEQTLAARNENAQLDPEEEIGRGTGAILDEKLGYEATGEIPGDILYATYQDPEHDKVGRAFLYSDPGFSSYEEIGIWQLTDIGSPREYVAGPYPVVTQSGVLGISSVEDFALPASCKNKELAWEFIKYCICARDPDQIDFSHLGWATNCTDDIPLNKENCRSLVEDMRDNGPNGSLVGYFEFDPTMDVDFIMKKLDEMLSLPLADKKKYGVDVKDYLDEFYVNELSTAEECAEKIQGRTEIWLNE